MLPFCGISPCRKSKILINSFQRYWSSKKPVICLDKSILDYKSWSTIFLDMEFAQENRIPRSFIVYYFQQMIWQNFDENSRKLHFGPILGPFYPWFGRTKIFLDNALMLLIIRLRINSEKTKRFRKKLITDVHLSWGSITLEKTMTLNMMCTLINVALNVPL